MKTLYILLIVIISFSCKEKKKEDPEPVSKSAPLLIEFTATPSGSGYCVLSLNPSNASTETFTTNTSSSINYTINKPQYEGGRNINFSSKTYNSSGQIVLADNGSYTIKVTYNGQVLANKSICCGDAVYVSVDLPFIP